VDVVHAAHPLLIPSRHAAQIVTIHDLFFLDHPARVRDEIRRDYPQLAPDHARRADAIITSSVRTERLIVERLGVARDRVYCCPPGAPTWTALGRGPNVPPKGYALLLGTLEARKNIGVVLDAFTRVAHSPRTPKLVIAGRATPDATEWLARISQPPLKDIVEYVGYVPDERREALFAGARMLLLPSVDEGFGLTALEAMSGRRAAGRLESRVASGSRRERRNPHRTPRHGGMGIGHRSPGWRRDDGARPGVCGPRAGQGIHLGGDGCPPGTGLPRRGRPSRSALTEMRIAIDARELAGKPTGVGRYLSQILSAWTKLPGAAAHEFILCSPDEHF
jgi:hypothetical protein